MLTLNKVTGVVLVTLTVLSAFLALGGIWGAVDSDTAFKLFFTFVVTGVTTSAVTKIAEHFYKERP
jgi:hypothetical protein